MVEPIPIYLESAKFGRFFIVYTCIRVNFDSKNRTEKQDPNFYRKCIRKINFSKETSGTI